MFYKRFLHSALKSKVIELYCYCIIIIYNLIYSLTYIYTYICTHRQSHTGTYNM